MSFRLSINGPYFFQRVLLFQETVFKHSQENGNIDTKTKRRVEGDLKLTQEAVSDLERVKNELNQTIQRKEKELASLQAKIEDEQTLGGMFKTVF